MTETTELRWFDAFPKCARCGGVAHGVLRGSQNQSFGHHCKRCAEKRLKDSARERERQAKKETANG